MRARLLLPLLLLALALAACGDDNDAGITDETTATTTTTSDGSLVTFTKGGGFAPVSQQLVVEADGTGSATAEFPGSKPEERVTEFELSDEELGELSDAVESTELGEIETQTGCADCFIYSIESAQGSTDYDDAMLSGFSGEEPDVPEDVIALHEMLSGLLGEYVPGPDPVTGA